MTFVAQAAAAGRDALRLEFTMPDGCSACHRLPCAQLIPVIRPAARYPHGVPVDFAVRESHLLKPQAAALALVIASAASGQNIVICTAKL